ncbi:unnamed protein product [Strongylus vulgaris]|uniref:glucuronosyltransferase n=1 Tax=Strongylus vulgaris TaxID=40348 RepID=A0A3P7IX89_STRVU|nr:unnamed protein product [Strongylus vulgaris]
MEGTAFAIGVPVIPSFMPATLAVSDDSASFDTVSNMSWILTNCEPLLEFAKPTLNNVVDLGGIGNWNKILNLRKRTVLISFGSVAPSVSMPVAMKEAFIEVIKS